MKWCDCCFYIINPEVPSNVEIFSLLLLMKPSIYEGLCGCSVCLGSRNLPFLLPAEPIRADPSFFFHVTTARDDAARVFEGSDRVRNEISMENLLLGPTYLHPEPRRPRSKGLAEA